MADVIIIGGTEIDSELIDQISSALGCGSESMVRILRNFMSDSQKHGRLIEDYLGKDMDFGLYDDLFKIKPIVPAQIDFPDFGSWSPGYSYHPNHGEPCDYLWVDPSDIHDQLCVLAGHTIVLFHRKCFMQLKKFVNLRFK